MLKLSPKTLIFLMAHTLFSHQLIGEDLKEKLREQIEINYIFGHKKLTEKIKELGSQVYWTFEEIKKEYKENELIWNEVKNVYLLPPSSFQRYLPTIETGEEDSEQQLIQDKKGFYDEDVTIENISNEKDRKILLTSLMLLRYCQQGHTTKAGRYKNKVANCFKAIKQEWKFLNRKDVYSFIYATAYVEFLLMNPSEDGIPAVFKELFEATSFHLRFISEQEWNDPINQDLICWQIYFIHLFKTNNTGNQEANQELTALINRLSNVEGVSLALLSAKTLLGIGERKKLKDLFSKYLTQNPLENANLSQIHFTYLIAFLLGKTNFLNESFNWLMKDIYCPKVYGDIDQKYCVPWAKNSPLTNAILHDFCLEFYYWNQNQPMLLPIKEN